MTTIRRVLIVPAGHSVDEAVAAHGTDMEVALGVPPRLAHLVDATAGAQVVEEQLPEPPPRQPAPAQVDAELADAIEAAATLDELKAALLGSFPGASARAAGRRRVGVGRGRAGVGRD